MISSVAMISEHASPLEQDQNYCYGSQHIYVAQLARHLVQAGVSVDVFTRCSDPSQPEIVTTEDGFRVIHIKAGPMEYIAKENLFPYMPIFVRNMFTFLQNECLQYDIVHAHFWMSAWAAMQLNHAPLAVSFHGLGKIRRLYQGDHDHSPDQRFKVEEQLVTQADVIIAQSQAEKEQLIDHYGANSQNIAVIPFGVDHNEFYPVDRTATRRLLHLPENTPIVLSVGRLAQRKGFDNVIRGFSCFRRRSQQKALLVIAAGTSRAHQCEHAAEIGRLQALAQDEGISDSVRFVGRCDRAELKFYYSSVDVFVTTPWYEPFGLTALESMACGTPVIASAVGGLLSSVTEDESGWLVEPRQPEQLGRLINDVVSNREETLQRGAKALRRARRVFDWNRLCSQIVRAYSSVSVSPITVRQAG